MACGFVQLWLHHSKPSFKEGSEIVKRSLIELVLAQMPTECRQLAHACSAHLNEELTKTILTIIFIRGMMGAVTNPFRVKTNKE
jgi:hypothetical protein